MSKYCRYCGKELADHALFCSGCGKPVGSYVPEKPKPSSRASEPNRGNEKKSLSEKRESARARKEEARRQKAEKKAEKKAIKKKS
jgi:predicted  nucleic acid-binding Zn-ribbon protein